MSACDELRPSAPLIASLPEADPERAAYLAHAAGCAECAQALRQAEKLLRLVDQATLPAPSAAALLRAAAPVRAQLSQPLALAPAALRAAAAVLAFLVPLLFAKHRDAEGFVASAVVLVAAAAISATAGALRSGALLGLAASAGFALAAGGAPGFALGGQFSGMMLKYGADCLFTELGTAFVAGAAAVWFFRKNPRPGAVAQAAAGGALAGQAVLHLTCGGAHASAHLFVFHVGGVLLAALIGFLLEPRLQPARSALS